MRSNKLSVSALMLAAILLFAAAFSACGKRETRSEVPSPTAAPGVFEKRLTFSSRGVEIPATVCVPEADGPCPVAVMIHGFGGTRESGGGYQKIAEFLYENGVASIRFDCPGCGKSTESFTAYCLSNIKQDAVNALSFMEESFGADPERVCLIGYSMGGRTSLELVADGMIEPCAMLLLAPAASTDDMIKLLGGDFAWNSLRDAAFANGSVGFGADELDLGPEFFRDLEAVRDPAPAAAERFTGRALVVYAVNDSVVSPAVSQNVADLFGCDALVFERGGHACGLHGSFSRDQFPQITERLLKLIFPDE